VQAYCGFERPRSPPCSRPPVSSPQPPAQVESVLRAGGVSLEPVRVCVVGLAIGLVIGQCESRATPPATPPVVASPTPPASPPAVASPTGAQVLTGGCGTTEIYKGGSLPDWALVNAPQGPPYVIATPGRAVGYLFSYPMKAGLDADTKILWYVATPRGAMPLEAQGHPLGAISPTAQFSKAADSGPGEIFPTSPTVPTAGCWHFTLTWRGGEDKVEVDLLFA